MAAQKWEYRRVTVDIFDVTEAPFEQTLNEHGAEGWELVASFDRERGGNSKECFFIFKRALGA
ncbi:MAG: hypothetical protein JWP97_4897 [Labilithrix sp.]|nr:hypothetical protein [Labilithrix sp.]